MSNLTLDIDGCRFPFLALSTDHVPSSLAPKQTINRVLPFYLAIRNIELSPSQPTLP